MEKLNYCTARCNGVDLRYALCGPENGKKVVLLHGWGCSMQLMQPVADALCQQLRVLLVDFPAHGGSGRPPQPWGVPDFAEALAQLLRQLAFVPCSAVAHSFGARVALYLAAEQPALFSRLVLTGAAGLRKPSTGEADKRSRQFQQIKKLTGALRGTRVLAPLADRAEEAAVQKYGSEDYKALDPELRKTFVKVVNQDLSGCLPRVKQPTLLLWGEKDDATPLWMAQRMEREIPDCGLVVLQGGTHFAYLEQIGRFCLITRQFLLGA